MYDSFSSLIINVILVKNLKKVQTIYCFPVNNKKTAAYAETEVAVIEAWTSVGLNQGPPDYESGRIDKSSPRFEGFSESNVHTHAGIRFRTAVPDIHNCRVCGRAWKCSS